jgi:hypothetical protein
MPFLFSLIASHLLLIAFLFLPHPAFAQTSPSFSVTPSLLQIDLRNESPDTEIRYKNVSPKVLSVGLSAKDFSAMNDAGKVSFLGETDAKNYHYSLSSWLQFSTQAFSLNPGEEKIIQVHIQKEKLPLGGHYAAILASFGERDVSDSHMISLQGVLSTLLFVRAGKGYEREEAKISSFSQTDSFPYFPRQFTFRFQNTGNVPLIPYGSVDITDIFGHLVARGIVNEGSLLTLPETIRRYSLSVEKKTTFLLPGIYHAKLSIHYGDGQHQLKKEEMFFSQGSIDWVLMLESLVAMLLVFLLYKLWRKPFK